MLAVSLGLLLVGSGVSIHLEEVGELPLQEASTLADRIGAAIEARTSRRAVLDDPLWPECREANRCVDAIRARTKTEDVVLLRIYSGPTKLRLIAERLSLDGLRDARIEENLPREASDWPDPIAKLAAQLFPEPPRPEEETAERILLPIEHESEIGFLDVAPWVVLSASVVVFAVGIGFGASSRAARNDLLESEPDEAAFDATFDRMQSHGRIANAMFIGGTSGVAVGGVMLMFTDWN